MTFLIPLLLLFGCSVIYTVADVCTVQENTVIYSNTIERITDLSMSECCDLCHETANCLAFSWRNSSRTCYLKSDRTTSNKTGLYTGFVRDSLAVKPTSTANIESVPDRCSVTENRGIEGDNYDKSTLISLAGCCARCESSTKCIAFTWHEWNNGTCWLKSKISSSLKILTGVFAGFVSSSKPQAKAEERPVGPDSKFGTCGTAGDQTATIVGENKCVAYIELQKTWYEAQDFCQENFPNGQLAWFQKKTDYQKFKDLLRKRNISVPNCITSDWSPWSSCQDGKQYRKRETVPFRTGINCLNTEMQSCESPSCDPGTVEKYGRCIPECPSYAVHMGDRCMLYSNVAEPFDAAEFFCSDLNGHLASFRSLEEQKTFFSDFNNRIKLERPGLVIQRSVHLGARKEADSSNLQWTNGDKENTFTNWGPKWDGSNGCLILSMRTGKWRIDKLCKNKAFLCEFPLGTYQEYKNEAKCGLANLDPVNNPRKSWLEVAGLLKLDKKEKVSLESKKNDSDVEDSPLRRTKRIARGFATNNTYWPWYGDLSGCGAALFHPQLVITAPHCGTDYHRVWFAWLNRYAGTDSRFADIPAEAIRPGIISNVRSGGYGGCRGDISVIKLVKPLPFTEMIRPACLPDYGAPSPNFEDFYCYATGRGSAKNKTFVGQLQMRAKNPRYINGAVQAEDVYKTGAVCLGDSGSNLNCRKKTEAEWFIYGPACGITGCEGITHKLDKQFVKHQVSEFSMEWNPNVELSSASCCALSAQPHALFFYSSTFGFHSIEN